MIRIRPNSNGDYWLARWVDSQGVRRSRTIGRKDQMNKREAEQACRAIEREFEDQPGRRDIQTCPTLRQWEDYYQAHKTDIGASTRVLIAQTFGKLQAGIGDVRIDSITPVQAVEWRAWLARTPDLRRKVREGETARTISDEAVCRHVRDAKAIFEYALELHLIKANPFASLRGTPAKVVRDWQEISRGDLAKLLAACPGPAWRCLFALCRLAGLRRGEALLAVWTDIDVDRKTIRVLPREDEHGRRRVTTKARAHRVVPIEPELWEILRANRTDGTERVCPVSEFSLHRDSLVIIARAGLPKYAKPFHSLRKNLETEWMDRHPVITVCQWLGHSPQVAAEHYVRASRQSVATVTGTLDPLAEAHRRIRELEERLAGAK